jgi:transcriptional regulator with XRE-family HTH domain
MNIDRLKIRRKEKGLTQEELSKIIEVEPSTIGLYEQGRREPDHKNLVKIANALDTTTDYLLDLTDNPEKPITKETIFKYGENEIKILTAAHETGLTADEFTALVRDLAPYLKKKGNN